MNPVNAFASLFKKINSTTRQIYKLVHDPHYSKSYFPEATLKSKWSILSDHLFWLAKHKEINNYYYIYGLDRKKSDAPENVLPYNEFMRIRDRVNLKPKGANFNYASLLRDKFIFGQFLTSLQFPTPKNIALFNNGSVTFLDRMETKPVEQLHEMKELHVDGFAKKLLGMMGVGAFPLKVSEGNIYDGETKISASQLNEMMKGQYLWQERLHQHELMATLHAPSVNTIRLISFNNNGNVQVFSGTLRVGTRGNRVDNWNAGGIAIGVDLATGTLRKKGIYKPGKGGATDVHPNTNIHFEGFKIPFFDEAVQLTKKLHSYFYGIHSIGWDIAITPEGPVFVEGNDDWDGSMPMALEPDFKKRFMEMYK